MVKSGHEQLVPMFQRLARGHPSGRDDVCATPAVAAQCRGLPGGAEGIRTSDLRGTGVLTPPLSGKTRAAGSVFSEINTIALPWVVSLPASAMSGPPCIGRAEAVGQSRLDLSSSCHGAAIEVAFAAFLALIGLQFFVGFVASTRGVFWTRTAAWWCST